VIEFSDLLTGKASGRAGDHEVTIFDSVGFALEDFSALRYLHRLHKEQRGLQQDLDLVPDLEDPKNLFGGLALREVAPLSILQERKQA
jgi:ornithine cyclodeaminase